MSDPTSGPAAAPHLIAGRIGVIGTEEAFSFGALIAQVEAEGDRVIKANLGQPDFPLPTHVADAVIEAIRAGKTTYCDPQGLPELRQAIAVSVGRARGLDIDPERVVVFPGGRPPIGFAQHAYVEPGDEVVYPTPSYPLFESFIDYVQAEPVPVPLREEEGFSLSGAGLEPYLSPKTKLVYLNFPSNPTGGVATREQLAEIGEVIAAKAHPDVRIYSDEAYEAIVFDGEQHVSIASLPGMEQRTIIATGASKTYSWTGGRVGWGIYPTVAEAKVMRRLNINYFASIPPYNQLGAKVALESPESPSAIAAMVEAFQHRRDIVVGGLNAIEGIRCQNPKGAFYVFPNVGGALERIGAIDAYEALAPEVRARTSPATLFQLFLLYRYRTATMDRRSFGIRGSEGQHFLRLSVATAEDELREAVERIAAASDDAEGFGDYVRSGGRLTL
ncbi:MAG: aminotransferase class I/II-fold pyridoxal phosphate-dependent enzyme [Actinobacteria bacterium]|nr:aminotransferase class I/II-fold pyridoxal phosphate-dependent enzyme [Actinomycetota bacterium]